VCVYEVVGGKGETAGETEHEFFRDGLHFVHEFQSGGFEIWEYGLREPEPVHTCVGELDLVGFFHVRVAGGGSDLSVLFPAGVGMGEGDEGFGGVW